MVDYPKSLNFDVDSVIGTFLFSNIYDLKKNSFNIVYLRM